MPTNSLELKHAAFAGELDVVRALIESGANPNSVDEYGSGTLLNFHPEVTAFLLASGATPDTQTNEFGASVCGALLCEPDGVRQAVAGTWGGRESWSCGDGRNAVASCTF
ncbi:MAG: ankyrin repeat domain-containing protein [Lacipirellulaceae bacterium]